MEDKSDSRVSMVEDGGWLGERGLGCLCVCVCVGGVRICHRVFHKMKVPKLTFLVGLGDWIRNYVLGSREDRKGGEGGQGGEGQKGEKEGEVI